MPPAATPANLAERYAFVARLLADPPAVHAMSAESEPPLGVWSTDVGCYRFLAENVEPGTRTLETGLGVSTALFAALGAEHRCVAPGVEEADRLRAYAAERDIDLGSVTFDQAGSHEALPRVTGELDLVLVDGSHAFPMPMIDWFYAGSLLRAGGVVVLDDLPMPAVAPLARFLQLDPRWEELVVAERWGAWRRRTGGTLSEEWTEQRAYRSELSDRELLALLRVRVKRRLRALLRR